MVATRRTRGFRLLAILIGLALALLAAEVVLRIGGGPRSEQEILSDLAAGFAPPPPALECSGSEAQARLRDIVDPSLHPDVVYELRPGLETCFEGAPVRTNSQGVRRRSDLESSRPGGTYRILALGDSHAFGWAIEEDATVAAQLEAALSPTSAGPVEVVNAGVPGYSTYQEAAWLEAYGDRFEPDCVVMLFVANDLGLPHFLLRPAEKSPSRLWDRVRELTRSKRWFRFAPNELATFVSEVDLERVPERYRHMVGEAGYREALTKMAAWAGERRVPVVNVFDYSTLDLDGTELVHFQESLGITAVELPWPEDPGFRVSETDPHLNRAGNAAVVEGLIASLQERAVCLPREVAPSRRPSG